MINKNEVENTKERTVKMKKDENLEMMKMTGDCEGINPTLYPPLNFRGGRSRRRMNLSLTSSGRVKAFTLAETLITLTILGVIAAITVPMLINKQMESANRTKLKKAMATYEKALNQMIIDNDIKSGPISAIEGFRAADNCSTSTTYFKKINGDSCRFQTADKVYWDITDIEHPVIAFNEADLDNADAEKRFVLVGHLEDGILRIDDKGYEDSITSGNTDNQKYMAKLYDFIAGKSTTSMGGIANNINNDNTDDELDSFYNNPEHPLFNKYPDKCPVDFCGGTGNEAAYAYNDKCRNCTFITENGEIYIFEDEGHTYIREFNGIIQKFWGGNGDPTKCDEYNKETGELLRENACHFAIAPVKE